MTDNDKLDIHLRNPDNDDVSRLLEEVDKLQATVEQLTSEIERLTDEVQSS